MKPIRITESNAPAVEAALEAVNGRASTHAFTAYSEIAPLAVAAENAVLTLLDSQRHAVGARYVATSGAPVANRYDFKRRGTIATLERRATGWFLIAAEACDLYTTSGGRRRLLLTPAQDGRAGEVLRRRYSVIRPETVA